MEVLDASNIRDELRRAWDESMVGTPDAHEEGGFVVLAPDGASHVVRWPRGDQAEIAVPAHPNCEFDGEPILASFHTHPNVGDEFLQEPGLTDRLAVRDDPDLKGPRYQGELV